MRQLYLSLISSLVLLLAKLGVGVYTNSLSILAEASHSLSDILSAAFSIFSIKYNFESLAPKIEAALLGACAFWVSYETLFSESTLVDPLPGIAVSALSIIFYGITFKNNHKHAHESDAVRANLYHLASDIGSSILTLLGLVALYLTKLVIIDKIIASLIVVWLLYLIFSILKR